LRYSFATKKIATIILRSKIIPVNFGGRSPTKEGGELTFCAAKSLETDYELIYIYL